MGTANGCRLSQLRAFQFGKPRAVAPMLKPKHILCAWSLYARQSRPWYHAWLEGPRCMPPARRLQAKDEKLVNDAVRWEKWYSGRG